MYELMGRSFDLVDWKLAEADFFLKRIPECEYDFFAVRCYVSAFIASARSVTFALQSCLRNADGFSDWYTVQQKRLREDPLARFFHHFRNANQHIGENPVSGGASGPGKKSLYFFNPTPDIQVVPKEDVETACRLYFRMVVSIVFDCYMTLGPLIDAKQRYTAEHFASLGKTIEDGEEELIMSQVLMSARARSELIGQAAPSVNTDELREMVRGSTEVPGVSEDYRWQYLRDSEPGCGVNHIFEEYLGKTVPEPERLPDLGPPSEEGWSVLKGGLRVYIPEKLRKTGDPEKDLQAFFEAMRKERHS